MTKNKTLYSKNPDMPVGVTLGDMNVTLGSLTIYLNGYTTPITPNSDDIPTTNYTPSTKPKTGYV